MYLFSRRSRLVGGKGTSGIEWASAVCAKVTEVTSHEVQLWATVYSAGFGTVSWTSWFDSLASLEAVGDALAADGAYNELVDRGAEFLDGSLDDGLMQLVHGMPDAEREVRYVGGVQAVIAGGQLTRAMGVGVELAMTSTSITGLPSMFMRGVTGPYGAVGWLTGYESMAEAESADHALSTDPSWIKTIDSTEGCFLEDPAFTQTTMYRRLA